VAVVDHQQFERGGAAAHRHLGPGPQAAVLEGVGERLLDDAVGRQLDAGGQHRRLVDPVEVDANVEAGLLHLLGQGGQPNEAGSGVGAVVVALLAEQAQQALQLGHRVPA